MRLSEIASLPESVSNIMMSASQHLILMIIEHCELKWSDTWFAIDIIILITGMVANVALLWLFLRERKSLSASQVGTEVFSCYATAGMSSRVRVR